MKEWALDLTLGGVALAALIPGVAWARRGWVALGVVAVAAVGGLVQRVLVPADLWTLPAYTGLQAEAGGLALWAVYALFARRAGAVVSGPPWLVAPLLGATLGEVPAAAILASSAADPAAASRLALAAAAGGLLGRVGDPAIVAMGARAPILLLAPLAALALLVARPRASDLRRTEGASWLPLGIAGAVAAASVALPLPIALGAGCLALGALALRRPGGLPWAWSELAWPLGCAALVLIVTVGGLPELVAMGLEITQGRLGRVPLWALTGVSGLFAALLDGPAAGLLGAATLDRALGLRDPALALAVAAGAALGGLGPLVAAGAVRKGLPRLLLTIAVGCAYVGLLGRWVRPL